MVSSGNNGSAYDVLYVLGATSNTAGTIRKYSLASGTWTANGSVTTSFGGFGLAVASNGAGGEYLYVTTGQGALINNSVIRLIDTAWYNSTIVVNSPDNVTLYTASGNATLKGISFVPQTSTPAMTALSATGPITTSVNYTATFAAAVSGLTASNFSLVSTGNATGVIDVPTTGNGGLTWTVPILSVTGDGTLTLKLTNAAGVTPGISNVPFTGCQVTVDNTAPTVVLTSSASDPTATSPISVTVTFSEPVVGFIQSDLVLTNGTSSNFQGSGAIYTFDLTPTAAGTVTASVPVAAAQDTVAHDNAASNNFSRTYSPVTAAPPTVTSVVLDEGTGGVSGTTQRSEVRRIIVTFSEAVNFTGSVASAFTLTRNAASTSAGTAGAVGTLTANPANGPASSVTITFSGAQVDSTGSLVDGLYDFSIDASKVSGAGGQLNGSGGGANTNYTVTGTTANKWFRYYGDQNADGTVDQTDYLVFRNALAGGPSSVFDYQNSGDVDQSDYLEFRNRLAGAP
ncbi:MAG: Ig-like domain-containing protein [Gemmataceae bacterium]